MKKILYIISTSCIGGAEKLVERLGKALNKNYDMDVLVVGTLGDLHPEYRKTFNRVWDIWPHLRRKQKTLKDIPQMINIGQYDIIHIFNHFKLSNILAENHANEMVQSVLFDPNKILPSYKAQLIRNQDKFKAIIVDSKMHYFLKNPVYIPNFVDTNFWDPDYRLGTDIVWVGKFNSTKNYKLLEKIIISDFNDTFHIVDGCPYLKGAEEIKKEWQKKYGERVKIYDKLNEEEMLKIYQKCRCLLITSAAEGTPISLLEAMSCGLIPVSTEVGNIPNIITDGETGFFYENPWEASDYLHKYKNDMVDNCREKIKSKFDTVKVIERYKEIYEK